MLKILTFIALFITVDVASACGGVKSIRPLDKVAANSAELLAKREFAALDRMVVEYRRPDSFAEDGQPNLIGMYEGLSKSKANCAGLNESDEVWAHHRALLANWGKVSPNSTAPLLALASFEIAYGWHARGGGYASTVSEQGFALLYERVENARRQLQTMPRAARLDPEWYSLMLDVAVSQGWPPKKFDAMFEEAVKHFPEYLDFYYVRGRFYSPQWYGSSEKLVDLMNQSAQAKSHIGLGLYARMYRIVDAAVKKVDFNNGTVSYPKMKASYESLLQEFPSNWLRNPYARYACIAEDWPVVRTQLDLIGDQTTDTVWNPEFYQWCQAKSAEKTQSAAK